MKQLIYFSILFLPISACMAQVKWVNPLPCDTWGEDKYLSYEEAENKAQETSYENIHNSTEERYNAYLDNKVIYSWWDDTHYTYIDNVLVIRWGIAEKAMPCKYLVTDLYDDIVFEIPASKKSCGVIIFPDSCLKPLDILFFKIKIEAPENIPTVMTRNFDRAELHGPDKQHRASILKEIQACPTLECKINLLKLHRKTLDVLSLLELEKMKDPQNITIDKLYWDFISVIRYKRCGLSEER